MYVCLNHAKPCNVDPRWLVRSSGRSWFKTWSHFHQRPGGRDHVRKLHHCYRSMIILPLIATPQRQGTQRMSESRCWSSLLLKTASLHNESPQENRCARRWRILTVSSARKPVSRLRVAPPRVSVRAWGRQSGAAARLPSMATANISKKRKVGQTSSDALGVGTGTQTHQS